MNNACTAITRLRSRPARSKPHAIFIGNSDGLSEATARIISRAPRACDSHNSTTRLNNVYFTGSAPVLTCMNREAISLTLVSLLDHSVTQSAKQLCQIYRNVVTCDHGCLFSAFGSCDFLFPYKSHSSAFMNRILESNSLHFVHDMKRFLRRLYLKASTRYVRVSSMGAVLKRSFLPLIILTISHAAKKFTEWPPVVLTS